MCDVCYGQVGCPVCGDDMEEEEELLTCYECDCEFHESELEKHEGLTLCPECLRNYKLELLKEYNEND